METFTREFGYQFIRLTYESAASYVLVKDLEQPMLYAKAGLETGVLVFRTSVHEEVLRHVLDHCEKNEFSAK